MIFDQSRDISHVDQGADLALVDAVKDADLHDFLTFFLILVCLNDLEAEHFLAGSRVFLENAAILVVLALVHLLLVGEMAKHDPVQAHSFRCLILKS